MTCRTPHCERAVPYTGHGYCQPCFAVILRTGRAPELPRKPEWLKRLTGRDETGWVKG